MLPGALRRELAASDEAGTAVFLATQEARNVVFYGECTRLALAPHYDHQPHARDHATLNRGCGRLGRPRRFGHALHVKKERDGEERARECKESAKRENEREREREGRERETVRVRV